MSKKYALILGVSSGIGASCARKLSSKGLNILGLYMRKPKDQIDLLINDIESNRVEAKLIKMNACNYDAMNELLSSEEFKDIKIKTFIHSLAFGAMKPFIADQSNNQINKKHIDMTLDVMSNSLVYWTQSLSKNKSVIKKVLKMFK